MVAPGTAVSGSLKLAAMRPDATLINTSRGPIVNTTDILDSLRQRKLAGAALDVFDIEPLSKGDRIVDSDLIQSGKLLLTPHLGYASQQTFKLFYSQMMVICPFVGRPRAGVVSTGSFDAVGRGHPRHQQIHRKL